MENNGLLKKGECYKGSFATFNDFLREVFVRKYHDDACITELLLEYHLHLAKLYMQEAYGRLENNNELGFKEGRSVLSQRVFFVLMTARNTEKERSSIAIKTNSKLEKLKCPFAIGTFSQMSEAYAYARKNCEPDDMNNCKLIFILIVCCHLSSASAMDLE
ncbi:hypothetical protein U3516DRAFT_757578 [Neocallimastix sp. 'constans']